MDKNDVVAVIMGGPSAEREISLVTGAAIAGALREKGYNVAEIDLEPKKLAEQLAACGAKVVFNAVHGMYGEDGRLQTLLEMLEMPYTGSGMLASALGMDKAASKRILQAAGIATPKALIFVKGEAADYRSKIMSVFQKLPVVIKAATQGSSIGVEIVDNEADIDAAVQKAFAYSREVVVEEFISGKELTVAIMQDGGKTVALPVINIVPHSGVYDFHSKYTKGATEYLVPAPLDEATTRYVQELAVATYKVLGCSGVARVDVMLDEAGKGYVLEANTVPGMTATSLVPKAAAAVGIAFPELCEKILLSASLNDK
ncbi:MAG: D-alanine--D-alanine ligase [Acidaminococcaceae bacterium]|nr:D-alanine--D-alanine ligase [Acidaminococcaceae bacterium]